MNLSVMDKRDLGATFMARFESLLEKRDATRTQVADLLGIHKSRITQWGKLSTTTNEPSLPSGAQLVQLAEFFGTSCDYLLGHTDIVTPITVPTDRMREAVEQALSQSLEMTDTLREALTPGPTGSSTERRQVPTKSLANEARKGLRERTAPSQGPTVSGEEQA